MPPRVVFRPLCRLIFGHAPIVEVNEAANKSEYVCERCGAVLGDFVTNLRNPGAEPVDGGAYRRASESMPPEHAAPRPAA
jgi:hypothetical protein